MGLIIPIERIRTKMEESVSERKCVNCRHNKRIPRKTYVECRCEIDDHYIGYVECFEHWCKRWAKDNKYDEDGK